MTMRTYLTFGTLLVLALVWPFAAQAGYCPDLPNCFGGGNKPIVEACAAGVAIVAGLCAARKQGGEWIDITDDFSGDDSGEIVVAIDEGEAPASAGGDLPGSGPASAPTTPQLPALGGDEPANGD
jgi:hypothetical protein